VWGWKELGGECSGTLEVEDGVGMGLTREASLEVEVEVGRDRDPVPC
jgi:hypothetical protein